MAKSDPCTAMAFAVQSPDAADREQVASLPNGYLLRLLWANRPPGKGVRPEDSEKDLITAQTTRPLANFCKDAGDLYAHRWRPHAAWQAYDFGRLVANHVSGDLLSNIDEVESALTSEQSRLF